MTNHTDKIAALIGSRICHDLISPVGALSNGLELLEMSGQVESPELSLVRESATNANARIRLFRLAFGIASAGQSISGDEISAIISGVYADGRVAISWTTTTAQSRISAQAVILAILCAEQALPFGGAIEVTEDLNDHWRIIATADRLTADPTIWAALTGPDNTIDASPAEVQFLLLPRLLANHGRQCSYHISATKLSIEF